MKYRYTGTDEKHLPQQGVLVKPGDTVETSEPIEHPEFELVQEEKGKKKSDN